MCRMEWVNEREREKRENFCAEQESKKDREREILRRDEGSEWKKKENKNAGKQAINFNFVSSVTNCNNKFSFNMPWCDSLSLSLSLTYSLPPHGWIYLWVRGHT
jgi:hypothetical protein